MSRDAKQWWYPLTAGGLDDRTAVEEAESGTHLILPGPSKNRGVEPGQYVWFYSDARGAHRPVAVGVVQAAYEGTDDGEARVVVALHREASEWLGRHQCVGLSTGQRTPAPRKPFQDVSAGDARVLRDCEVAQYLKTRR